MEPGIMSISEASKLLGMSHATIYRWVRVLPEWAGCISHKSGRKFYLSVSKLKAAGFLVEGVSS